MNKDIFFGYENIRPITITSKNNVYIATKNKSKYIIKEFNIRDWFRENDIQNMNSEFNCFKNLNWDIMPKLIDANIKKRYLITKYINSNEIKDSKQLIIKILKIFKDYIINQDSSFIKNRDYKDYLNSIYSRAKELDNDKIINYSLKMIKLFEKQKLKLIKTSNKFSHGDFRKANLLMNNDKLFIIDFDQAREDNLLYDLASFYMDILNKELKEYFYNKIKEFEFFDKEIFNLMIIRRCIEILYTFNKNEELRKTDFFSYCIKLYTQLVE